MFKLYFGNVANFISTCFLITFFIIFNKTIKNNPADVNWKRMSIIMLILGIVLSATGGIKDSMAIKPAITFGTMNIPFILLCGLGIVAIILGVIGLILKRASALQKKFFYLLSFIILTKVVILEGLRIIQLFV